MSLPSTRLSYQDVYDILDKATTDPRGIRLPFGSREEAVHFRMRVNAARSVDRRDNRSIYSPDDPMYGQSIYDKLVIRIREGEDGTSFIYIEPRAKFVNTAEIEYLSDIEGDDNGNTSD